MFVLNQRRIRRFWTRLASRTPRTRPWCS